MSKHVTLCAKDDIPSGTAKRFDIEGHRIAVVCIDDDVYAIGDTCSHAEVSLSEGDVYCDEREIECWKHGSTFSLTDGKPQSLPATAPVPTYNVQVIGNEIVVELS